MAVTAPHTVPWPVLTPMPTQHRPLPAMVQTHRLWSSDSFSQRPHFFFFFLAALRHMKFLGQPRGITSKPQLWQCWVFNPPCSTRDQIGKPALQRHCQSCCTTVGTPIPFNQLFFLLGIAFQTSCSLPVQTPTHSPKPSLHAPSP